MWSPISAGMAGRPHPQALDRPLLGVPGSCPAPSQCSLITLGHPQVPGWAVAFRRGPCMSPTFSHPPVPGLEGSVASGPTRPSSRSGHSWWAPDSPAVRRAHSSLAQPAGPCLRVPRLDPGARQALLDCTAWALGGRYSKVIYLPGSSVLSPQGPGHGQGWGAAKRLGGAHENASRRVGLGPGFPACAAGFPHTPRMFTTDPYMHPREINTAPRGGVGTSIAVLFSVVTTQIVACKWGLLTGP